MHSSDLEECGKKFCLAWVYFVWMSLYTRRMISKSKIVVLKKYILRPLLMYSDENGPSFTNAQM